MHAGYSGVGMGATWTSARLAALAIGSAALLGCSPDQAPSALHGTWYSEDERFAGRTLEIDPQWIRFKQGAQELSAVQVRSVTQEGSGGGPIRFEIEGSDREGEDATLAFDLQLIPSEQLRMETQAHPWRRTPHVASKSNTVPWKRPRGAVDSGGIP
jgi:hypothetical protein